MLRVKQTKSDESPVLLQAMKMDPPLDAKCRDKFLVQSVAITHEKEFSNVNAIVRFPVPSSRFRYGQLTKYSGSTSMTPKDHRSKRRRSELYG